MLARRRHIISFAALLVLLLIASISSVATSDTGPATRVLILPFQVNATGGPEKELGDFKDHVDRRLRQVLGMLGDGVQIETEEATRLLVQSRGAINTEQEAIWLASESAIDLMIFGTLSKENARYRLRGIMWDVRQRRLSVTTDLQVGNIHGLPGVLEVFVGNVAKRIQGSPHLPLYKAGPAAPSTNAPDRLHVLANLPRHTGPWRSPDMPAALKAVDIGDLDGDSKSEIVFIDNSLVTISRFEDNGLRTLAQFSEPPAQYISAQVQDVDGDGIAELILCYRTSRGIESAVARYVNRNFQIVARLPFVVLAAIPDPLDEKKKYLVGQRTDVKDIFSGEMVRFRLEGNEAVPEATVNLPPGTLVLSYAMGRLGKPAKELQIILGQDQRLMAFDRDNQLVSRLDRLFGEERVVRVSGKDGQRDIIHPGRIEIVDTNGDGENELLVVKQTDKGGLMQALVWDGSNLALKWRTVANPGVISDFRIADFKNQGSRALVLLLVRSNPFLALTGGVRTAIFAYDLLP